ARDDPSGARPRRLLPRLPHPLARRPAADPGEGPAEADPALRRAHAPLPAGDRRAGLPDLAPAARLARARPARAAERPEALAPAEDLADERLHDREGRRDHRHHTSERLSR